MGELKIVYELTEPTDPSPLDVEVVSFEFNGEEMWSSIPHKMVCRAELLIWDLIKMKRKERKDERHGSD